MSGTKAAGNRFAVPAVFRNRLLAHETPHMKMIIICAATVNGLFIIDYLTMMTDSDGGTQSSSCAVRALRVNFQSSITPVNGAVSSRHGVRQPSFRPS